MKKTEFQPLVVKQLDELRSQIQDLREELLAQLEKLQSSVAAKPAPPDILK